MTQRVQLILSIVMLITALGCTTAYKAQPLPFKAPAAYGNMVETNGIQVGAQAFTDTQTAQKAFGFGQGRGDRPQGSPLRHCRSKSRSSSSTPV